MLLVRTNANKETEYNAATVYESFYIVVFFAKMILSVFVLAVGLKSAIQIGHPSFYKPAKWLQNV